MQRDDVVSRRASEKRKVARLRPVSVPVPVAVREGLRVADLETLAVVKEPDSEFEPERVEDEDFVGGVAEGDMRGRAGGAAGGGDGCAPGGVVDGPDTDGFVVS